MRKRTFVSLVSLGAAFAAATSVHAQPVARLIVCRDGAQIASRSARVCAGRGGVDVRATEYARQRASGAYNQGAYNQGAYNQGAYRQGGYVNHGQAVSAGRHADHDARREARQDDGRRDDGRRDDRHDDRRPH